jgi:hypothetical protein
MRDERPAKKYENVILQKRQENQPSRRRSAFSILD